MISEVTQKFYCLKYRSYRIVRFDLLNISYTFTIWPKLYAAYSMLNSCHLLRDFSQSLLDSLMTVLEQSESVV